ENLIMARITYVHFTDNGTKPFGMFYSEQADEFEGVAPLMDCRTQPGCLYRTDTVGWILNRVLTDEGGADHSVCETASEGSARQSLADNDFHDEAMRWFDPPHKGTNPGVSPTRRPVSPAPLRSGALPSAAASGRSRSPVCGIKRLRAARDRRDCD